jgi:hypothetical protein
MQVLLSSCEFFVLQQSSDAAVAMAFAPVGSQLVTAALEGLAVDGTFMQQ